MFGNIISSLLNQIEFLKIGFISFIILALGLIFSIFSRERINEIIIYSIIIIGFILTLSSSYTVDRYVLPLTPLFFAIISFLIIGFYKKGFSRNTIKNRFMKICFVGLIITFFVIAIYFSEYVQIFKIEGFEITNPIEKSLILSVKTDEIENNDIVMSAFPLKALQYNAIPFDPLPYHPKKSNFDQNYISKDTIDLINETMSEGYNFYVLKKPHFHLDEPFLRYLVENYDFVLKEHSTSFCKLEINKEINQKSDEICFLN